MYEEIIRTPEFFKWFKSYTRITEPKAFWHDPLYKTYDDIEHEIGSDLGGIEELEGHNAYYVELYQKSKENIGGIKMNLDFTDVQDSGFKVLPKGEYTAVVKKVEQKENKAKDGHYLNFQYEITGVVSVDSGEEVDVSGATVFDIASLKQAALWKLKSVLKAFGYDVDGPIDLDPEELAGIECVLKLDVEQYNGNDKNVVKDVKGA